MFVSSKLFCQCGLQFANSAKRFLSLTSALRESADEFVINRLDGDLQGIYYYTII